MTTQRAGALTSAQSKVSLRPCIRGGVFRERDEFRAAFSGTTAIANERWCFSMMFVFASIGNKMEPKGWPIHLMHATEATLLGVAAICFLIAIFLKRMPGPLKALVVLVGGFSTGVGLVMPFELAPFFFGSRGEIMMMTIGLNLVYPVAVISFAWLLMKMMKPAE